MLKFLSLALTLIAGFLNSTVVRAWLVRAAVALGISAVTYTGISVGFNALVAHVQGNLSTVPADILGMVSLFKIPQALSVILSAYGGALALRGLSAVGAVTKLRVSGSGSAFNPFSGVS